MNAGDRRAGCLLALALSLALWLGIAVLVYVIWKVVAP